MTLRRDLMRKKFRVVRYLNIEPYALDYSEKGKSSSKLPSYMIIYLTS